MIFAVFESAMTVQKGLGHIAGRDFTSAGEVQERG